LKPNPNFIDWLNQRRVVGSGRAIKVGSGLGDDAEELSRRGFETTAFDISESAIAWSRKRFPQSYRLGKLERLKVRWLSLAQNS
jgi:ubiquinone/menaquinone biosynthesis C-methylase UbiE